MAIDTIKANAIFDGAVDTADLANGAVTSAKLDTGAVTTAKLDTGAVTSAKLDTNIDIAGTLDVTGKLTADSNLLVGSGSAVGNANANELELTNPAGSGTVGMTFNVNSGSADTGNIYWRSNAVNNNIQIVGDPVSNYLAFATNGTEKMRILSSGGITFNGDTAATNALDDYEEGTLVPSLSCTNSNAGITYTTQVGKYVKIGNKVHVVLYIELSSKGSASGNVRISGAGFPFAPSSTSGFVQTGHVALNGTISGQQFAGQNDIWGQLSPGDATLRIYADSDGDVVQLDTGDIGNVTSFRVNMSYFV